MGEGAVTDSNGDAEARHLQRRRRRGRLALALAVLGLTLVPAAALAAFPGANTNESVRANTPNDPGFDPSEPDRPGGATSTNPFDSQTARFGFAPNASQATAMYDVNAAPARQVAQNTAAGRNPLGQVSGVSADRAWKFFGGGPNAKVGNPEVEVAILDTGVRWGTRSLRLRISLNRGELPLPRDGGTVCGAYDCNSDGAFNVDDYVNDPRVAIADGNDEADAILDGSDLLAAFSNGVDSDGNGFTDDIAGWDFFDDDNDPYDASSYSAASNHGTGRANDAAQEGDDGDGGIGVCPDCQIVPLRVWDTFVVDTNQFALGVVYAADNDVEVVEGAVGGLLNTRFARESFAYAYDKGTLPVIVSSDLNTADHNYPTNYDQALHVQGTVADVNGLGANPPEQFIDFFNALPTPLPVGTNLPIQTWFRNSGTTQYGGHAHIVMPATTGSEATGQASGAAALLISYARRRGIQLEPNEIKQLLTGSAEDVDPRNTDGLGVADPAQVGWDQHFGYGRPDLGLALQHVKNLADGAAPAQRVPPEAMITSPDWFAPLNLARQSSVSVGGNLSAERSSGYDWELQWAPGIEPCEAEFKRFAGGSGSAPIDGDLGSLNLATVRAALDARTGPRTTTAACQNMAGTVEGGSTPDPTAPAKGPGDVDPNEPAFTVRLRIEDAQGNVGEDRKVLFDYRDTSLRKGWSRPIGGTQDSSGEATSGGESSQRMYDLDGDNKLEIVEATSSGELHVLQANGSADPNFNDGKPVRTGRYAPAIAHAGQPAFGTVDPPEEALRVPSIGDIDGDREPEIVDTAAEHIYAWEADGKVVDGFPVRIDPANSRVADRSRTNHIKRGFFGSAALGDLDGDGELEIAAAGLDEYLYVYEGDGKLRKGFPVYLRERNASGDPIPCSEGFECAESINTPAIGDIDGDDVADIVVPTNEFDDNPGAPGAPTGLGDLSGFLTNVLANALGGSSRVYAVDASGKFLDGWPTTVTGILPDVLPLVGPGVDHVLADVDGDGTLDVVGNAATGDVEATAGDGSKIIGYESEPAGGEHVDKAKVLNLFENPVVANLDGTGGLEVVKGGVTLNQVINLGVLTGQNLPYNHVLQAWSADPARSGLSLPAFPQAVEDYQLLSSPAVADVSNAAGNEAIVGTGLYLIRNINSTGVEGSGWPKFTGGWNYAVPSVGDVDGDGKLEVASQTREGFSFMWGTTGNACDGGNDEWWTYRHDEWNTGSYETDSRLPGTPENLTAEATKGGGVRLSFKAPGDDWLCGKATAFQVRTSANPIDDPFDGKQAKGSGPAQKPAGAVQRTVVPPEATAKARFAAVLYRDDAGNWGHLASVRLPRRVGPPGPGGKCSTKLNGSRAADVLDGSKASERITGRGGDDKIRGRGGVDCIDAGNGNDRAQGQGGSDTVNGGFGKDNVKGGQGRDRLRGNNGADRMVGGPGNDRIRGGTGGDRISGGSGKDRIAGGSGKDRIKAGAGPDRIKVQGSGRDRVDCGPGRDVVRASHSDRIAHNCEKVRYKG